MKNSKKIKPTDSELEILQILWEKGEASVREVHEVLSVKKDIGYTTALKLMQIMYEKGLLQRDDSSRTHIYKAQVSREETQEQILNKLIDSVFKGSAAKLVMQALGNNKSSKEEIAEIKQYLDELENKQQKNK